MPEGKTLTIRGTGILDAEGGLGGAGIGGGININCGNIVINGGIITAKGGSCSAGIGGGQNASCGYITMNGGVILKAEGGYNAAGIGCGDGSNASCEAITINGGQIGGDYYQGDYVQYYYGAIAGSSAASIGCGKSSSSTCGTITIGTGITCVVVSWHSSNTSYNCIGHYNITRTPCDIFFGDFKAFDKARPYWYNGIDAYNTTLPKSCGGITIDYGAHCWELTPDTP